jgi:hypothetical protein
MTEFDQWIEREKQVYLAHTGRDGTLEGFQEHILKLYEQNPAKIREMMLADDDILDFIDLLAAEQERGR